MYYQTIQIPLTKGYYSFISRWRADLFTSNSATLKDKDGLGDSAQCYQLCFKQSDKILVQIALFNLSIKRTHNQSPLRMGRRQKPPSSPRTGQRTKIARTYQEKAEKSIKK